MSYGRAMTRGRPINIHSKPKTTQQIYTETLQKITFMRRPGESIADIISRIVTIYAARSEGSEYYQLWQEQYSRVKSLEEQVDKKDKRITEIEIENKKLKRLVNDYLASQMGQKPVLDGSRYEGSE
jgi:predicted RNase H-like nuclease (RuvC/YqgF family)